MDILNKITHLREERNWTEYQLSVRSTLPQSTISSWYRKDIIPSIPSLEKICTAFGITLSQFFSDSENAVMLTQIQEELLTNWNRLDREQQLTLLQFLKTIP